MKENADEAKVALKFDGEKPQHGLISSTFLTVLAKVLTFGAKKYASHNWRKGFETSRLYDSIQRHLVAWNDGEDLDPESGLPHLAHAACGLMFLTEQMEVKPELDNRYKPEEATITYKKYPELNLGGEAYAHCLCFSCGTLIRITETFQTEDGRKWCSACYLKKKQ